MTRIKELSETLTNQIAAGEVIERPASVVKELVENAIDANSTHIEVLIEEAGLKKIQVIDNGDGIASDEVKNAFKRHATSKIYSRDDLFRIRSLGFRGEALPSIASVSEIRIETSDGLSSGMFLYLKGGKVEEEKASGSRKGTTITVENLFFNTPARLKYVKSLQTELANVSDIVNRLALSHPNVAFRLVHDDHQLLRTTGNGDLRQALAGIYGVQTAKKMRPVANEDLDFKVTGYISLPELTRASRNYMSLIVNGRYIKNYALSKAVIQGYGSKLMVGRFPIVALEIEMDPLLVDVNVHPTKQEVRISKEKELMGLISSAVKEALGKEQLIPDALEHFSFKNRSDRKEKKAEQMQMELENKIEPKQHDEESFSLFNDRPTPSRSSFVRQRTDARYNNKEGRFFIKGQEETASTIAPIAFNDESAKTSTESETAEKTKKRSELLDNHQGSFVKLAEKMLQEEDKEKKIVDQPHIPSLAYIGQMHGTYLFAQNEAGLYILDQHAAQERIKYEYFRKKIGEVSQDMQELLVPIMLDYPSNDALKIKENQQALEEVGIYLEAFGQNSFLLRFHPVWIDHGDEEKVVREMIDMLLINGSISVAKFREATAIMMSCKGSIKANHYLNDQEARALIHDLAQTENPYNCPHGRPVIIHFSNKDMERMFKRIQDPH